MPLFEGIFGKKKTPAGRCMLWGSGRSRGFHAEAQLPGTRTRRCAGGRCGRRRPRGARLTSLTAPHAAPRAELLRENKRTLDRAIR
eukprot:365632-Chlamydomonas_euryale.AAC.28